MPTGTHGRKVAKISASKVTRLVAKIKIKQIFVMEWLNVIQKKKKIIN